MEDNSHSQGSRRSCQMGEKSEHTQGAERKVRRWDLGVDVTTETS